MQITKKKRSESESQILYDIKKTLLAACWHMFFLFMSGRAPRLNYHTRHCTVSRDLLVLICYIWEEILRLPTLLPGNRGSGLARMRQLQIDKQKGARRDGYSLKETKRRTQTPILLMRFLLPLFQFNSVQSLSRVRLFVTPWTTAHQGSLSITNSWSLFKLMSIE